MNHIYIYWHFQRSPEFMFIKGSSWDLSYASYWVQMLLGLSSWRVGNTQEAIPTLWSSRSWRKRNGHVAAELLYGVLWWKMGMNWGIQEGSERHVTHMGFDISPWETIPPLLPGPLGYSNGWHLWEGTGVTDTTILMRGAGPVMEELHSMKWTPSRGQRRRKCGRMCISQTGSWPQETSLGVSNTSKGGLDPFKVDG